MKIYEKLIELMMWRQESFEDDDGNKITESATEVLEREQVNLRAIPDSRIIDVVHSHGLEEWAKKQNFKTLEDVKTEIMKTFRIAISCTKLANKKTGNTFPPLQNFFIYANKIDRSGRLNTEAQRIAETVYFENIIRVQLEQKTTKMFSVKPDPEKFKKSAEKIREIWGFTDAEIDGIRYFVCQTRHENHNPSMNKSLYFYSRLKQTGKTTLIKTLAAILNGEESIKNAGKFSSTMANEMQFNPHALPKCVQYNCTIMDEVVPKDSRKIYGQFKGVLTENTLTYNQKYGRIIDMVARRHYLFASNDDISDFIQDDVERRFIPIILRGVPKQLSFSEIFDIWKDFCQNAIPENDWQMWYNSFDMVAGLHAKTTDSLKYTILTSDRINREIELIKSYSVTQAFFEQLIITGKPTSDERKALNDALINLFGEPNYYRWSTKKIKTETQKLRRELQIEDDFNTNDKPF